ncbi:unnamed protein product [Aphanomyces euteiches]
MSLWTDNVAHVLWLDSTYPTNVSATTPGVGRGTCDMTTGVPKEVQAQYPDATVKYSNIRVGDLGTTTTVHTPSTIGAYSQCGGNNYAGPTSCVSGYVCHSYSEWYSQCIPTHY